MSILHHSSFFFLQTIGVPNQITDKILKITQIKCQNWGGKNNAFFKKSHSHANYFDLTKKSFIDNYFEYCFDLPY